MRTSRHLLRRGLLLAVVAVAVAAVVGRLRAPVAHTELLPSIGGDTWPPVPVKDVGNA